MNDQVSNLPLSVLDFLGIEYGETAAECMAGGVRLAQAVEACGYRRYWISEHHNMLNLACSAPEILIAHIAAVTSRIRVGAAGIMLPNHTSLKVAEMFRTLLALYPGRIDLALGRASGTDPLAAHVLRRGVGADPAAEFPQQMAELLAFLGEGFPDGHQYRQLVAAPVVQELPEMFMLGSSEYGPRFAAVNGMSAAFAHHMNPAIAVDILREYRQTFTPRHDSDAPYAVLSVLAFASEDPDAVAEFRAAWALTMANIRRGIQNQLEPSEIAQASHSPEFRDESFARDYMVVGRPQAVVERLMQLQAESRADELVLVSPGLDRARRIASYQAIAQEWQRA
ncbi:luciferase family oxidoreductase group 1 [Mycolicibacterium sp. BK634]|uniref:LLM class flavin-dependent oxidoreductase n=1 Tax=Mycobacteriaceae TaxID=1762 RepID=UPI000D3C5498|nr:MULTISPECIES: LLM class flavin-dependent oxidoreductase [Mycobacteriaceae]MBB3753852.1 luciferase family oxidoreductase group 1 [Mycolicibacterium sp. BK634]TDO06653.1 luciferase family oxidoreductase group 1 [Mycobacterium sp. BK086]